MSELTETNRTGDAILSEAPGTLSRENAILASGNLEAGTVLGAVLGATATAAAGNTGDGAAGAVTFGPDAEIGDYTLTCTAEASNAGTFAVLSPSGIPLPNLTVAAAYTSSHINLTLADGAEDFDVGDVITISVDAGNYVQFDPDATSGAQAAAAILYAGTNAADAATACVVVARQAEVKADCLVWPDGITDAEKAAAILDLNHRGIFVR
jgi:hypothetical protein